MSPEQIVGQFKLLKEVAEKIAGSDLPDNERKLAQYAADAAISIIESLVIDINRIANAVERIER